MDTHVNNHADKLDFASFIRKFFIHYQFDQYNTKVISQLGLWAIRSEKFNNMEDGWHIDRGILLSGPVGAGKDEMFRLLRSYLSYLRTPYGYDSRVVWKFAKPFEKDGYAAFNNESQGNIYYEELALTDESTGEPTREMVKHFGNQILIGSEIINMRAQVFKETGYQTHFSTNLNYEDLCKIYGKRCGSRLSEMCNYVIITGVDRRGVVAPQFLKNKNIPAAPAARETTLDEHIENKKMMEAEYQRYCENGELGPLAYHSYTLLSSYGCKVATDDELREMMEEVAPKFVEEAKATRTTIADRENNKRTFVWEQARRMAVGKFFDKMKAAGAKTIFEIVDVNIAPMVKELLDSKIDNK